MVKDTIENIFNKVSYWQEKNTILCEIKPDLYYNKNAVLSMLHISPQLVSSHNQAKRDMWNHQIHNYNMGDDILKNTSKEILDDFNFAKSAIIKYNRTFIYLSSRLKASKELAKLAAQHENNTLNQNDPILKYMPQSHKEDSEIAIMATTRNIENLQYAPLLQTNKYFILDMIKLLFEDEIRHKVLKYMDPDLLNDKRFVSRLGCFDGLCERFKGDIDFVSYSVLHDIAILDKTELFDEKIVAAVFNSKDYENNSAYALTKLFEYIEHFNESYEELEHKISNKQLLHRIFWELAKLATSEFV